MFTARSGGSTVLCSLSAWAVQLQLSASWAEIGRHWFCLQGCPGVSVPLSFPFCLGQDEQRLVADPVLGAASALLRGCGGFDAFPASVPHSSAHALGEQGHQSSLRGSAGSSPWGLPVPRLGFDVNTDGPDGQGSPWGCQSLLSPAFMPCRSCSLYWNGNKNGSQLPREISETVCCRKVSIYVQKKNR